MTSIEDCGADVDAGDPMISKPNQLKIHAHLSRFKNHRCPVCEGKSWDAGGFVTVQPCDPENPVVDRTKGMPLLMIVCHECKFVRTFAWKPIADASNERPCTGEAERSDGEERGASTKGDCR